MTLLTNNKLIIFNMFQCTFQWMNVYFYENITLDFKNHCTKHRLACTHFDAFSMLIPNMDIKVNISEIFEKCYEKL